MQNIRNITEDIIYLGANDRKLGLFEAVYPVSGVNYNSYLINDDKTILMDTVDKRVKEQFFENLEYALNGKALDYLIVQHMEPDHCALIEEVVNKYPNVKVVTSAKAAEMIKQFFNFDIDSHLQIVKEGDTLKTKNHELTFVAAPMVHWPEVIVTYDIVTKTLFSADAFGSFGAYSGNIFDDEIDFTNYFDEARRYYTNIVGKYGAQVQALLKKASNLEIKMICPLHGVIVRKHIIEYVEKYLKWSSYTPEKQGVVIAYSSIYGNTENVANILANKLAIKGVKDIKMYDTSMTHYSYILADAFKYSHVVLATTTYNMGVFVTMEHFIHNIVTHNLQNRKYVIIQNGSWAINCEKSIKEQLEKLKGSEFIANSFNVKSAIKNNQMEDIDNLACEIVKSLNS